ncbi:MAG: FAD-binding protein, partial [Brachymonas sp.]
MNAPVNPQMLQKAERLAQILPAMKAVLPAHAILYANEDITPYECDGLTAYRQRPLCVVLPETYEQVAAVLRACHDSQVPVVARGAGT